MNARRSASAVALLQLAHALLCAGCTTCDTDLADTAVAARVRRARRAGGATC